MNPMRQAVGLHEQNRKNPRALPWAGMNQAFGLKASGYHRSPSMSEADDVGNDKALDPMQTLRLDTPFKVTIE